MILPSCALSGLAPIYISSSDAPLVLYAFSQRRHNYPEKKKKTVEFFFIIIICLSSPSKISIFSDENARRSCRRY